MKSSVWLSFSNISETVRKAFLGIFSLSTKSWARFPAVYLSWRQNRKNAPAWEILAHVEEHVQPELLRGSLVLRRTSRIFVASACV